MKEVLHIRIDNELKEKIKEKGEEMGLNLSNTIRMILTKWSKGGENEGE